ncbi:MAG: choice-of-anchor A family protein [Planctomycetes bacterium]|nr:choice-of-anchor A family protein [Planctomycetota bacterium]
MSIRLAAAIAGLGLSLASAGAGVLNDYNLIVLSNLDSNSEVEGRAYVGGSIVGGDSSNYGTMLFPRSAYADVDVLTVVGSISSGNPLQIEAGDLRLGGSLGRLVNFNGAGGNLENDPGVGSTLAGVSAALAGASASMLTLTADSTASLPGPQPGPLVFNCNPGGDGVAVFSVSGSQVFSNSLVQQIELNLNGASAVVINVSGTSINFNQGNMVGAWNTAFARANVIWNFHEATNILIDRAMNGAVLAPLAHLRNNTVIEGSTFVSSMFQRGEVHLPGYTGYVPTPGAAGVLALAGVVAGRRRR